MKPKKNFPVGAIPVVTALGAGLLLTIGATIAPYVDRVTGHALARHIESGYPDYGQHRVDAAVNTWLTLLTVMGIVGAVGWVLSIWAVSTDKGWARWSATLLFLAGTTLTLAVVLTKDTSGAVGLTPVLGRIEVLPCLPGVVAVAVAWRAKGRSS